MITSQKIKKAGLPRRDHGACLGFSVSEYNTIGIITDNNKKVNTFQRFFYFLTVSRLPLAVPFIAILLPLKALPVLGDNIDLVRCLVELDRYAAVMYPFRLLSNIAN